MRRAKSIAERHRQATAEGVTRRREGRGRGGPLSKPVETKRWSVSPPEHWNGLKGRLPVNTPREHGARDGRQDARGRRAGGEPLYYGVNPPPPKPCGKRYAYGQPLRGPCGAPSKSRAKNGRGTGAVARAALARGGGSHIRVRVSPAPKPQCINDTAKRPARTGTSRGIAQERHANHFPNTRRAGVRGGRAPRGEGHNGAYTHMVATPRLCVTAAHIRVHIIVCRPYGQVTYNNNPVYGLVHARRYVVLSHTNRRDLWYWYPSGSKQLRAVFRAVFLRLTAHDRRKMCGVRGPNASAIRRTACRYGVRNETPAAPPPGEVDASLPRIPCELHSARLSVFSSRFETGPKSAKHPN